VVNDKNLYPMDDLLERLRSRQDKLAPVDAAFEVSYELLSEDLRRRWRLLAVFPASFDLPAAAAVWGARASPHAASGVAPDASVERPAGGDAGQSDRDGRAPQNLDADRDAMQTLVNASLVEWNKASDRFRLHDFVRQFCDGKLNEDERIAARLRHARHYSAVSKAANKLYLQGGENVVRGLELFDRERTHLEAAFEFLSEQVGRAVPCAPNQGKAVPQRRAADNPPYREAAALLISLVNAVVYTGDLRFHPRQRIIWLEGQFAAARIIKDRKMEGAALGNLGLAYADLGEMRKAIEFCEQSLKVMREIGDRRGEGAALWNSAVAFDKLGDRKQAIARAEAALKIFEAIKDPNAATVRATLARWRCNSNGTTP
jgi:tetratricopeptide (TPR) repeat protein